MEQRRLDPGKFTQNVCPVNWSKILGDRALFAKDLLNDRIHGIEYRSDTVDLIAEACRDIRKTFPKDGRGLVILKSFNLITLVAKETKRMIGAKHWEDEITKRVEENISKEYYADMIIPIAFDGVWILLTFNYEKRQAQIVYFQKEVEKHDLKLLHPVADFLWREGGRMCQMLWWCLLPRKEA